MVGTTSTKEQSDSFEKVVLDEDVLSDNGRSPKQGMIDAVNQLAGITKGNKEFLEEKRNSTAVIEKLKVKVLPQDATTERLKEETGAAFDEVTEEAKANSLPLVPGAGTKGWDGVPDQNSIRNGIDGGVPKDIVPLPMVSDNAEDSLANDKGQTTLAGGSFAGPKWCHCVSVKNLAVENKVVAALCVSATASLLGFLPTAMRDEVMTGIDVVATPKPDISTFLHLKAFLNIVAKGDEILGEVGVTVRPSFGRAPVYIEETVVGKVGKDNCHNSRVVRRALL